MTPTNVKARRLVAHPPYPQRHDQNLETGPNYVEQSKKCCLCPLGGLLGKSPLLCVPPCWAGRVILGDRGGDAHGFLSPGVKNDPNRRFFNSRRYSRMHSGTERRVHVEVTWFSV